MTVVPCCTKSVRSQYNFEKVVHFLKIINEPNRLQILCLLRQGDRCVCDIFQQLHLPQNLVSHHLKVLKDIGLITSRQGKEEGRKIIYSSHKENIQQYATLLHTFLISKL